MQRMRWLSAALAVVLPITLAGCGDDDDDGAAPERGTGQEIAATDPEQAEDPPRIEITASDYAFDVPATISGGLVDLTLDNTGKEVHFAAFAQPTESGTVEDVKAAVMALASGHAPAGPPPFVEYMALGTVEPGGQSRLTGNLPTGGYVLFCMVPAPDGQPHVAKGMIAEIEVTGGSLRGLPATDATIVTADFAIGHVPKFKAGTNRVTLQNKGDQIHEIDLVQLGEGKKVEDIVAWVAKPEGPPPARFLGGPAIRDGLSVNTTFEMEPGARYALVCVVPDHLGDGAPHITKGMYTPEFHIAP